MEKELRLSDLRIGQLICFDINNVNHVGFIHLLDYRVDGTTVGTYYRNKNSWYTTLDINEFVTMKNIRVIRQPDAI